MTAAANRAGGLSRAHFVEQFCNEINDVIAWPNRCSGHGRHHGFIKLL